MRANHLKRSKRFLTEKEESFFASIEDLQGLERLDPTIPNKADDLQAILEKFKRNNEFFYKKELRILKIFANLIRRRQWSKESFLISLDSLTYKLIWSKSNMPAKKHFLDLDKKDFLSLKKKVNLKTIISSTKTPSKFYKVFGPLILLPLETHSHFLRFIGFRSSSLNRLKSTEILSFNQFLQLVISRLERVRNEFLHHFMDCIPHLLQGMERKAILEVSWKCAKALGAGDLLCFSKYAHGENYLVDFFPKRNSLFTKYAKKQLSSKRAFILTKKETSFFAELEMESHLPSVKTQEDFITVFESCRQHPFSKTKIPTLASLKKLKHKRYLGFPLRNKGRIFYALKYPHSHLFLNSLRLLSKAISDELSFSWEKQRNLINERYQKHRLDFTSSLERFSKPAEVLDRFLKLLEEKYFFMFPCLFISENRELKPSILSDKFPAFIKKMLFGFFKTHAVQLDDQRHPMVSQFHASEDITTDYESLFSLFGGDKKHAGFSTLNRIHLFLTKKLRDYQAKITLLKIPKVGMVFCLAPYPLQEDLKRALRLLVRDCCARIEAITAIRILEKEHHFQIIRANAVQRFEKVLLSSAVIELTLKIIQDHYDFQNLSYFEVTRDKLTYWKIKDSILQRKDVPFPPLIYFLIDFANSYIPIQKKILS